MYKNVITLIAILATAVGLVQAADPAVTTSTNDPMVMKIYPDGTKVVARWSEIGKAVDNGEKHGGSPRIIFYCGDDIFDSVILKCDPMSLTNQKHDCISFIDVVSNIIYLACTLPD